MTFDILNFAFCLMIQGLNYHGEGKIYAILLVQFCDLVAPLGLIWRINMRKANLFKTCLFF